MMKKASWSVQEQASFLKRSGELLLRGYTMAEAIESLSLHLPETKQVEVMQCLEKLQEGYPFHQILVELQFNKDLVNYVYFAEQHGGLAEAVIEGSEMVLKRASDYLRLKKLIAYPLFLAMLTAVLFYFVQNLLLPKFTSLYENMNVSSNLFMKIIIVFSTYFPIVIYILLFSCFVLIGYFGLFFRKYSVLEQRKMLTKIPVFGTFLKLLYSQSFSVQFSYLFSSGMSVIEALNVFENNKHEPFSQAVGREIKLRLAAGAELEQAIADFPFFESELCTIIKHGQANGKLAQELFFYSRHCLTLLEEWTEKGMKIVQPVLYSVIGFLIVSLYLAILLPMFELIQGI